MKMRFISAVFLAALFALPLMAQKALKPGNAAPNFVAASMDGKSYDLAEMRGQVVVLTFWSTRCAICHEEIPKLNSFMSKYDPQQVTFLAASLESEAKIAPYLRSNPFKFNILPDSLAVLMQYADQDREGRLNIGFPAYFVIDKQGKLAYRSSGWDHTKELASRISQLIAAN